jgi:DNA (cytosine-5)-methyltransferase 1
MRCGPVRTGVARRAESFLTGRSSKPSRTSTIAIRRGGLGGCSVMRATPSSESLTKTPTSFRLSLGTWNVMDLQQSNSRELRELHLFAGAGGGILGGQLLGHRCVCAVEREPYAQAVLVERQNDGTFPPFPIWDDVCSFDGRPWRGIADVVCGGFPCQDISIAGNGAGLDGERSGLWSQMARIIGEIRPRYAYIENSPALVTRGLDRVLADLAAMGFDARWGVVSAADVGASHRRERIWIMGYANRINGKKSERESIEKRNGYDCAGLFVEPSGTGRMENRKRKIDEANAEGERCGEAREFRYNESAQWTAGSSTPMADSDSDSDSDSVQRMVSEPQQSKHGRPSGLQRGTGKFPTWPADPADAPESGLGRVVDGMAHRSHRIKAIGNGQVSRVAAAAWSLLI